MDYKAKTQQKRDKTIEIMNYKAKEQQKQDYKAKAQQKQDNKAQLERDKMIESIETNEYYYYYGPKPALTILELYKYRLTLKMSNPYREMCKEIYERDKMIESISTKEYYRGPKQD